MRCPRDVPDHLLIDSTRPYTRDGDLLSFCNLHQLAPVGPTSPQEDYRPLPLADSGTYSYDSSQSVSAGYTSSLPISTNNNSPPPDVDSGTPCYTPQPYLSDLPPQGSDTKDMHFNSPLQVADLRTHGDFGRKSAENNRHGECNLIVDIFLHTL